MISETLEIFWGLMWWRGKNECFVTGGLSKALGFDLGLLIRN